MIKTAMDQGFVDQCIRRGIQDPGQIQMLAKVATDQVNQAEMQKRAADEAAWYQRLLAQANAHPEIAGALAGGGIGAGIGGLATGTWGGAGAGAIGGGLLGAGGGYLYGNQLAEALQREEMKRAYGNDITGLNRKREELAEKVRDHYQTFTAGNTEQQKELAELDHRRRYLAQSIENAVRKLNAADAHQMAGIAALNQKQNASAMRLGEGTKGSTIAGQKK